MKTWPTHRPTKKFIAPGIDDDRVTGVFIAAALFIGPFMSWAAKFRRHLGLVEKLMGALLILFGVLIATNSINYIAQWMLEHIPWFGSIG